ncbi:Lipid phosphate phosphatase delta [Zea mays]|uniref:Lipid phosphate phosphatase delta n=1 Tax=Zea mays TaxID=4577 RepID=A0A3L6FC29_MAIZE|nr:Lipid phosphate phosphatase delta [Zea mays]
MEERREMDPVTDAHRVAWLQHSLLVLLQIHHVRLHLDGDAAVHRPTTEDICYYLGCHLTSSKATRNLVTEIFNFSQDDLLTEDMMILDTHGEVFIWIGQYVESKEKQKAFDIGQAYHRWDASAGREDVETLAQCQRMIACGEWPPLVVAYDHVEGSTMEAGGMFNCLRCFSCVESLQKLEHKMLDNFFSVLSCVISVPFYTGFLPLLFWSGHSRLARQMILLMAFCDYLGNSVKDMVSAPRPCSPPIRRVTATEDEKENAM